MRYIRHFYPKFSLLEDLEEDSILTAWNIKKKKNEGKKKPCSICA